MFQETRNLCRGRQPTTYWVVIIRIFSTRLGWVGPIKVRPIKWRLSPINLAFCCKDAASLYPARIDQLICIFLAKIFLFSAGWFNTPEKMLSQGRWRSYWSIFQNTWAPLQRRGGNVAGSVAKRPLLQPSLEVSHSLNIIENHTPGRVR